MRASIRVEGFAEAIASTGGMRNAANHPERVFRSPQVRRELEQAAGRRFRRGVRRPTAEWTERKRRAGLSTRTFEATGNARDALAYGRGPAARGVLFKPSKDGVRFGVQPGSPLFYLQPHAKGYTVHGRQMPRRRVVVIDRLARENIARLILDDITGRGSVRRAVAAFRYGRVSSSR